MKQLLAPLLCAALLATATNALALAGDLKEPGVALPHAYPKSAQELVRAALTLADCKFLGGRFINWHTSLNYAGDTKALNQFLDALAKCPGITLHVTFVADPMLHEGSDWHLSHDAHENSFHVRVSLKSDRIKLPDLRVPAAKGPALRTAATVSPAHSPVSEASAGTDASPVAIAAAAKRGETSATADLKVGQMRIFHYGKPWSQGKPLLDDASGYRVEVLGGCAVTAQFVAEVDAYNRTVREWHSRQPRK